MTIQMFITGLKEHLKEYDMMTLPDIYNTSYSYAVGYNYIEKGMYHIGIETAIREWINSLPQDNPLYVEYSDYIMLSQQNGGFSS